jgi:hypothetical protein
MSLIARCIRSPIHVSMLFGAVVGTYVGGIYLNSRYDDAFLIDLKRKSILEYLSAGAVFGYMYPITVPIVGCYAWYKHLCKDSK